MIYPSFLTNGSTIGICAPSAGAGKDLESFDACLDTLKQQGYNIKETQHVRVNDPRGGSAKQRGDELNQLFQDPEVYFVMCANIHTQHYVMSLRSTVSMEDPAMTCNHYHNL